MAVVGAVDGRAVVGDYLSPVEIPMISARRLARRLPGDAGAPGAASRAGRLGRAGARRAGRLGPRRRAAARGRRLPDRSEASARAPQRGTETHPRRQPGARGRVIQHVALETRRADVDACVAFWALLGFARVEPPPSLADRATWVRARRNAGPPALRRVAGRAAARATSRWSRATTRPRWRACAPRASRSTSARATGAPRAASSSRRAATAWRSWPQRPSRRSRPGTLSGRLVCAVAEPRAAVEREAGLVGLGDVELDPPAAALAGALERRVEQRAAQARAAGASGRRRGPRAGSRRPARQIAAAVPQLRDAGGAALVVRGAEQELGVGSSRSFSTPARNALSDGQSRPRWSRKATIRRATASASSGSARHGPEGTIALQTAPLDGRAQRRLPPPAPRRARRRRRRCRR